MAAHLTIRKCIKLLIPSLFPKRIVYRILINAEYGNILIVKHNVCSMEFVKKKHSSLVLKKVSDDDNILFVYGYNERLTD